MNSSNGITVSNLINTNQSTGINPNFSLPIGNNNIQIPNNLSLPPNTTIINNNIANTGTSKGVVKFTGFSAP